MNTCKTVRNLIDQWPVRRDLASDLGVTVDRVNKWVRVESIPARYHAGLLRAAWRRGYSVSAEDLVRMHDRSGCETVAKGVLLPRQTEPASGFGAEGVR